MSHRNECMTDGDSFPAVDVEGVELCLVGG